jgi:hypothetical protein
MISSFTYNHIRNYMDILNWISLKIIGN